MKDEDIKDLLSDILLEQKTITKAISASKPQLAKILEETQNANQSVRREILQLPNLWTKKFIEEFDVGLERLRVLAEQIPSEIKSTKINETKIVLFSKRYDEGNYGAKDLLRGFYLFLGTCFFIFILFKYGPRFFGNADENIPFKQTMEWYYYKTDASSREALVKTFKHFKDEDTLYINELRRFSENNKLLKK